VSRYWESLDVAVVGVSSPRLSVTVHDLPGSGLLHERAKSAKQLKIEAAANECVSDFSAFIDLELSGSTAGAPLGNSSSRQSSVSGRVVGPGVAKTPAANRVRVQVPVTFSLAEAVSIIGPGYDPDEKRLYLGIQRRRQTLSRKYTIKVRDPETALGLRGITVVPEVIEASFEAYAPERGLYRLGLNVPPSSLDRAYIGKSAGSLTLQFDHPRIRELNVALEVSPGH
ncbi:MAG: hypothetical protein AAF596_08860, partial [Planctomycetota bacterium]